MSDPTRGLVALLAVSVLSIGMAVPATASPSALRAPAACTGRKAMAGAADPAFLSSSVDAVFADLGVDNGALVLTVGGRVVYRHGYGYLDREHRRKVNPATTVFYAASNAKVVVATAVMQLAEQGRVDLRADVNRYLDLQLPNSYPAPVTLDGLLTHTAGLDDHFLYGLARDHRTPLSSYLTAHPPRRVLPPGTGILYSNHGSALAGYIVQRVSGEPFDEYARRHIFEPLSMAHTTYRQPVPASLAGQMPAVRGPSAPLLNPYPAGGLVTTPMDFGRLLAALLGGTDGAAAAGHAPPPLRDETLTEMLANHYRPYPAMPGAAYGFFEGDARGCRALHHTGDGGDHSLLYLLPDAGIGFFLVYGTPSRGDAATVREAFTNRFLDRILGPKTPPTAAPPPAGGLGRYVGVYRNNQYAHDTVEKVAAMPRQMMIGAADGALTVQLGIGGPRFRLTPAGGDLFRDPDGAYVAFQRGADGAVDGLSFNGGLVDDPGSASRIGWWEDARLHLATLGATVALAMLGLVGRLAAVVARRRRRRRLQAPQPAEPMYRLARQLATMTAGLAAVVPVALGATLVSLWPPITSVPPGVYLALALLTAAAGASLTILPAAAVAIYNRQGPWLGRAYLVALGLACYAVTGVLAYWRLLGWQT